MSEILISILLFVISGMAYYISHLFGIINKAERKRGLYLSRSEAEDMVDMLESLGREKYWWAEEMAEELRKRYGMTEAKGEK